jgi:hypothetical protein
VSLVAPELMVGKALVDLISAPSSRNEMKTLAEVDGVEWSVTHGFYANMGGFVVRFTDRTPIHSAAPSGLGQIGTVQGELHHITCDCLTTGTKL